MRCPKCGFISFDHLATCKNCGRNVIATVETLLGTCSDVDAPIFLQLREPKTENDGADSPGIGQERSFMAAPPGTAGGSGALLRDATESPMLDFGDDDEPASPQEQGGVQPEREIELLLDDAETVAETLEDLKFGPKSPAPAVPASEEMRPVRSFADIDISDLTPPPPPAAERTSIHKAERVQASPRPRTTPPPSPPTKPSKVAVHAITGQLEPLELGSLAEEFAEPVVMPKAHHPPVRTGTPLDDFVLDRARLGIKTPATGTPLDDFTIDPVRLGLVNPSSAADKRS